MTLSLIKNVVLPITALVSGGTGSIVTYLLTIQKIEDNIDIPKDHATLKSDYQRARARITTINRELNNTLQYSVALEKRLECVEEIIKPNNKFSSVEFDKCPVKPELK